MILWYVYLSLYIQTGTRLDFRMSRYRGLLLMAPLPRRIDAIMDLTRRSLRVEMPLHGIKTWSPFKIDALGTWPANENRKVANLVLSGLVTLLGAEEVNLSIGTLQRRRYTEYLPLLAAFVVAGDRFRDEQAGYALYNITDGIYTTELKGWFTRWLALQRQIRNGTTIFHWDYTDDSTAFRVPDLVAPLISLLAVTPLLVCTILMDDGFGIGNTVAIILSILVRVFLLRELRQGLNGSAMPNDELTIPAQYYRDDEKPLPIPESFGGVRELHRESSQPTDREWVKFFATRADGKMVTIHARRSISSTFFRDSQPPHPRLYHVLRGIGWAAFGAHICILGMSTLFTQIYTVALLVFSTWILCSDLPLDLSQRRSTSTAADGTTSALTTFTPFGPRIAVVREDPDIERPGLDKRMWAYARAEPTEKQEMMMRHWSLLPFDGAGTWYETYGKVKAEIRRKKAERAEREVRGLSRKVMSASTSVSSAASEPVRLGAGSALAPVPRNTI